VRSLRKAQQLRLERLGLLLSCSTDKSQISTSFGSLKYSTRWPDECFTDARSVGLLLSTRKGTRDWTLARVAKAFVMIFSPSPCQSLRRYPHPLHQNTGPPGFPR